MFLKELWESIFTPGTSPALVLATHASFVLLLLTLGALIYMSGSIHYVNLFVISLILYGLVVWFIGELQNAKLQSNAQLQAQAEADTTKPKESATTTSKPPPLKARKRKV